VPLVSPRRDQVGHSATKRCVIHSVATMLPHAVRLPWRVRASVPVCVAALELVHPSWADGAVSQAIASAGVWWIPLHVFLLLGYCLLVGVVLWPAASKGSAPSWWPRAMLAMFCIFNTAYLVLDGLIVPGVDAATADQIWNSPWLTGLANAVGATWAAALLVCAPGWLSARTARAVHIGLAVTWLAFVAGAAFPATTLAGRFIALTTGAALVYARGAPALPFALLVFAAVLRQHVGPEAALAMVFVAAAIALRERSNPAAASPP
jgi:hypothetical protein